ncbi:MAG: hypothetical protein A2W98_02610 [Bacteroidetes bacterium GWF2_33_38]|nr:MAG: hypothetical protein A2W98_02610 [Bacteroidetes bacterium GWF2_33_38]OFY85449.1 MAG: hypothetical protein A2236_09520 [Bacteroidetes bacterium RIFOXYA2_FULL_33_7]
MSANAQIIYTDIDPDTTIVCPSTVPCTGCDSSHFFYFDLNLDGSDDFYLTARHYQFEEGNWYDGYTLLIEPLDTNALYWTYLSYGSIIGENLTWYTIATFNSWPFNTDHYVGLRLFKNNQLYYGWLLIRPVVLSDRGITIKEYAYNTIPNKSIKAGETITGVPSTEITDTNIYITNKILNVINVSPDCIIDLYNMNGQKLNTYTVRLSNNPKC